MIKVLFLIHDLGPGGAEKVLVNLVNNMNKKIFDITLIALFGGGINEKALSPDVKYRVVYKKTFPMNSYIMKLFSPELLHKTYIREKFDIEISYLEGPSARIISGCKDKTVRLVSWVHSCAKDKRAAAKSFRSYKEAADCYGTFDMIAAVSQYVLQNFYEIFPAIKDISVIYNTIETEKILRMKEESVPDDIFSKGEFKICGVGKIVPLKGFMKLARVHKRLVDHGYSVHTYILGEGSEREKIELYIKENNLTDSFTFLGYQTNPYKYVAQCDVFVCSSSSEGFSTAATESVTVNTPVITTPVSGMKELLGEDPCGVITGFKEDDLYRELERWIRNPEILKLYKGKTIARAKQFSQQKTVESVESLFLNLLGESR